MPQRKQKRDWIDTLTAGLDIASKVYGIKEASDKSSALKQQQEDTRLGVISPEKQLQYGAHYDVVEPNAEGSFGVKVRRGDVVEDVYFKPKKQEKVVDPTVQALREQQLNDAKFKSDERTRLAEHGKTLKGRLEKLSTTEGQRLDNARLGLKSVIGMKDALESGDFTFSPIGDNNFTRNGALFEEAIGRMQSGGAITDGEANRFRKMAPTFKDSAEMQKTKLTALQEEMTERMKTIGFTPEEFNLPGLDSPKNVAGGAKEPPKNQEESIQEKAKNLLIKKKGISGSIRKNSNGG